MDTPKQIQRAIRLFYISNGLQAAYFATGTWLFFWRLYMDNGQIGLLDGSCFLAGMLADIPSGAIADRLGRRRTILLGQIMMAIGYSGMGIATSGWHIWLGFLGVSVGTALYSGADDAMLYDYLKAHSQTERWESIARRKQLIKRGGAGIALFVGGYLNVIDIRWPFYARGIFFALAMIPIMKLGFVDKFQPASTKDALVSYRRHIWTGMRELINRQMLPVLLLIIGVQGIIISIFIGGVLRPLMLERSSLPVADHSLYLSVVTLIITLFMLYPVKASRTSVFRKTIYWSLFALLGFALNIPSASLLFGLLGIFLIHVSTSFLIPTLSTLVNYSVSSKHRATSLSTANVLENVPYILTAPLIGMAADLNVLTNVIIAIVAVMALTIGFSILLHRQRHPEVERIAIS